MQLARSGTAFGDFRHRHARLSWRRAHRVDPRRFGRGREWQLSSVHLRACWDKDLRLFVTTFLAGFLFVSVLIA